MKLQFVAILLLLFLCCVNVAAASNNTFDIVRPNAKYHDCVDRAVLTIRENPEYTACSISRFSTFKMSHMVAVKVINAQTLEIVEGNYSYYHYGWANDGNYYHFWVDRDPLRNWGSGLVKDNRQVIL